jgi:hypothetical protein
MHENVGIKNTEKKLIIRNKFGAAKAGYTHDELIKNRKEFLNSIQESHIVWAPRGDANQSMRLYEALSAGRVVLVPNSKMTFPFNLCSKHSVFYRGKENSRNRNNYICFCPI